MSVILPRLPHIQNFSLKADVSTSFRSLPMDFVAAIEAEALCRSPNLTTLYLDGIVDFPFATISTWPNLRCLRLWASRLAFDNVNSRDENTSSHLLHLESLEVDWEGVDTLGSHISEDVSIAKCFSRMKNLQLEGLFYNTDGLSRGWDVIHLALQTLKNSNLQLANASLHQKAFWLI